MRLWGTDPVAWHLTNLLLLIIVATLAGALGARWARLFGAEGNAWEAAYGAFFFALHSAFFLPVVWVSASQELLCLLFILVALSGWTWFLDPTKSTTKRRLGLGATWLGYALAPYPATLARARLAEDSLSMLASIEFPRTGPIYLVVKEATSEFNAVGWERGLARRTGVPLHRWVRLENKNENEVGLYAVQVRFRAEQLPVVEGLGHAGAAVGSDDR